MITIKDVAKEAGVSIATVSHVLNNTGRANEDTWKRVRQAAEDLGYIPNSLAQSLLSKKTNIIGIIISDISNLYNASFIKYLNIYAKESGYFLLIGSTEGHLEEEKEIVDSFIGKNVEALIIAPHNYCEESFYEEILEKVRKRRIPLLFANMNFPTIKTSFVVPDLEEGEYLVTKYLLDSGLKDLIFIGGDMSHYYTGIKYKGFTRALEEYKINYNMKNYIECGQNYNFNDGRTAVKKYLGANGLPEAFVVANDVMAYGVIKGLKEIGLKVPEDVSVVGFDDIEMPVVDSVPITTVRIPLEEIARLCIEIIKNETGKKMLKQYILQPELVIRESVKPK
jgi:Transcriptional regulators